MIEQYTSPVAVNNSQEPWLVGEGVVVSGGVAIPSLDFNFITGGLPGTVTFTRGSNATQFNSSGNLVYAPNNAIRNNTMVGAVAGTPGTAPTNWTISNPVDGITPQIVGTGTLNGITYIDVKYTGTSGTTGATTLIGFEQNAQIAALNGQTWTSSAYVAIVGGSTTNISALVLRTRFNNAAAANLTTTDVSVATATSTLSRFVVTGTATDATTAFVNATIVANFVDNSAIDITLRIGLPQLEIGPTATAVNRTSGTAYYGPRFDYNPATLAARGLLIEEQRTNLLLQSEDFATTWTTSSSPTITTNTTTAPDGTTTADTITSTATASYVAQTVTFTGDGTKTFSIFIKAGTSGRSVIFLRDATAAISRGNATITWSGGVPSVAVVNGSLQYLQACPNGWYRLAIIVDSVVVANSNQLRIQPDNLVGTGSLIVWGAQIENAAFSTSYIPTTTTALTRNADVASVNTLSPWFNQTEFTLYAEHAPAWTGSATGFAQSPYIAGFNNSGTVGFDGYGVRESAVTTSRPQGVARSGATSIGVSAPTGSYAQAGVIVKSSFAMDSANIRICANGGSVISAANTVYGITQNTLQIGFGDQGGTAPYYLNGWLRRLTFYPRSFSNAEMQSITA